MLEIKNLCLGYNGITVLEDVSFQVEPGKVCGLFGPNGSGKTTLMRCCSGSLLYAKGSVKVNGREISRLRPIDLAKLISYVPQSHTPPFPFQVKEVVLMGRNPHLNRFTGPSEEDLKRTEEILGSLRIRDLADRPYTELSGGQRQLVILARALNQDTQIMLLDEPASSLDFKNQIRLWMILRSLASRGKAILACTHDPNHISWFCDHSVVLYQKRVVVQGSTDKSITENVMKELYGSMCTVESCNGKQIVMPSEAAFQVTDFI